MVLLVIAALQLSAQQPTADLILSNAKVITVDEQFRVAQAVAIKDGRILQVGSNEQIMLLAGPNTRTINLHKKSVIPGLIDNHMHLSHAAATWAREVRLDNVESRRQAVQMLAARAQSLPPGEWLYTIGGWTRHQFVDDQRPFTRADLDRAAPNNPLAVQESYFRIYLNSQALRVLGLENENSPELQDMPKGAILRDSSGKPTGVIEQQEAIRIIGRRLPEVPRDRVEPSMLAMISDMNRVGLTSFGSVVCEPAALDMYRNLKAQNRLNVRAFCMNSLNAATPEQVTDILPRIRGTKLFQGDNYVDEIAYGETVYLPLHDPMFLLQSSPTADQLVQWRRVANEIAAAGLPLHVHASLNQTIDAFLGEIEQINKEHPIKNLRWMLAHDTQLNAPELERMKKLGMYAAVNPWAVINGGIFHEIYGERAYEMPALATIQDSGIMWGFGSDATTANQYNPMVTLSFAVTGKMVGGAKVVRQTISREDALIAHTRKNAYFLFQEDNLGAIQPGKLADLVVLDGDYLTVPAGRIKDLKSVMTIVGGRIVYDASKQVRNR